MLVMDGGCFIMTVVLMKCCSMYLYCGRVPFTGTAAI